MFSGPRILTGMSVLSQGLYVCKPPRMGTVETMPVVLPSTWCSVKIFPGGTLLMPPCPSFPFPGRLCCYCIARWRGQSWGWCSVLLGVFGFHPPSLYEYPEGQFWHAGDHYSWWVFEWNLRSPSLLSNTFVLCSPVRRDGKSESGWSNCGHIFIFTYILKLTISIIPCSFHKNWSLTVEINERKWCRKWKDKNQAPQKY